jgi:hypothetical protein
LEFIFESEFPKWDETSSWMMMQARGLTKSVRYSWRKNWLQNHSWRPWNYSVHGRHHWIFSDNEETGIKEFVVRNDLIPGHFFCEQICRDIAIQAFLAQDCHSEKLPEFNRSSGLIDDFKETNRMSFRSIHYERRPTVDPIQEQE